MSFGSNILLVTIILTWLYYLWSQRKYYYLSWKMNSVLGLPLIGVALNVRNQEKIISYFSEHRSKLPSRTAIAWFGTVPIWYVSEPDIMKKIFTSTNFINKSDYYDIVNKHFGVGLFSSKSPEWNHHRKLLEPAFNIQLLKSFMPIFNKEADILIMKLEKYIGNGTFHILPLIQLCIMDIACLTTIGKWMNFQENQNLDIVTAYCTNLKLTTMRMFNPVYQLDFIFNMTHWATVLKKSTQILNKFVNDLIYSKLEENNCTENSISGKCDINDNNYDDDNNNINTNNNNIFINRTLELYRNKEFSWNDVKSETNMMIVAAYETSSNTISHTIMCLAMFPEYQEKLFEELASFYPNKNDFNVTQEDLNKLEYLEMCLNETMRVMAPVPLVARSSLNDYQLNEDICIPKGTQCVLDIFNMQRDELYWGANAKIFNPGHFTKENLLRINKFAFSPFTRGIRNCIGSKYAMLSVRTVLAKILRKYKFTTKFNFNDLQFVEDVTLKLKVYPQLEIEERKF